MITAEQWRNGINSVLDEYGLSREEFWKTLKHLLTSWTIRQQSLC